MKLKIETKEQRFNKKLEDFKKLDTFIDIKGFLNDLNVTNSEYLM